MGCGALWLANYFHAPLTLGLLRQAQIKLVHFWARRPWRMVYSAADNQRQALVLQGHWPMDVQLRSRQPLLERGCLDLRENKGLQLLCTSTAFSSCFFSRHLWSLLPLCSCVSAGFFSILIPNYCWMSHGEQLPHPHLRLWSGGTETLDVRSKVGRFWGEQCPTKDKIITMVIITGFCSPWDCNRFSDFAKKQMS